MSSLTLPSQFSSIPHYPLSYPHPSPIHGLPNLSTYVSNVDRNTDSAKLHLGRDAASNPSINLYAKRDDQAGPLTAYGNKYRKFEYLVPDILSQAGVTTLVTEGGPQSNHTVQVAGLARLLGLECLVLLHRGIGGLRKAIDKDVFLNTGNVQLNHLLGAEVRWTDDRDTGGAEGPLVPGVFEGLRESGKVPYWISSGASLHPLGGLGYARCAFEIVDQERTMREAGKLGGSGMFDHIFVACGSGSTVAGLVAGFKLVEKLGWADARKIVGVLVSRKSRASQEERILGIAKRAGKAIGLEDEDIVSDDIVLDDRFVGEAYGICDSSTKDTLNLVMKSEAVALDPVYTAKVMRGMLHVASNEIQPKDDKPINVLFIHTGGQSALPAYADRLAENPSSREARPT